MSSRDDPRAALADALRVRIRAELQGVEAIARAPGATAADVLRAAQDMASELLRLVAHMGDAGRSGEGGAG